MNTTRMNRFTKRIILRTDYTRADGNSLLCLQCHINGKRTVCNLSQYTSIKFWDLKSQVVTGPDKKTADRINAIITQAKGLADDISFKYEFQKRVLTSEAFKAEFERPDLQLDFLKFVEEQIKFWKQSKEREHSTLTVYATVLNELKAFRNKIAFSEINYNLVKDFNLHLVNKRDDKGLPEKHQKAIQAHYQLVIIAEALNGGW